MSMETCESSGSIAVTAGTAVRTRPCKLHGSVLIPAAADSTITIYDNASAASGTILLKVSTIATLAGGSTASPQLPAPIEAKNGLFVVVTGTGATAIVFSALM